MERSNCLPQIGTLHNYQLTFFCGSTSLCRVGGNLEALQKAKYNADSFYSVIGLTVDLQRTFDLMEAFLPRFFTSAAHIFEQNSISGKTRMNVNEEYNRVISNLTLQKLLTSPAIENEYEFYNFVKQRFEIQYRDVFATSNTNNESENSHPREESDSISVKSNDTQKEHQH